MTTIQDIFREVQPLNHSFSEARRQIALSGVKFNGEQVTSMMQEVEVKDGSLFQVGKSSWQLDGQKWIRLGRIETDTEYRMDLVDFESDTRETRQLRIRKSPGDQLIMIGAEGYGECATLEGGGFPIVIEFHEGKFRLMVWGDINEQDPTHVISLEGAREDARTEIQDGD